MVYGTAPMRVGVLSLLHHVVSTPVLVVCPAAGVNVEFQLRTLQCRSIENHLV